jgi:hypothetical protein
MTETPTPTALRPITVPLRDPAGEVIGEFAARLVLTAPGQSADPGAYAVTHGLGSFAGGSHTEVAFTDSSAGGLSVAVADEVVRAVANALYARSWAFTYSPDQVPNSVLRYGSILRERVEVSDVQVYA